MKLKLLAISDTHLGEDCSLLSFPQGRQCLWRTLDKELALLKGKDGRIPVEEMILIGDIPDRTLSSTAQIIADTNQLMETIGAILTVQRGVYIPGNHDHNLWKAYRNGRYGEGNRNWITAPAGEFILKKGKPAVDFDQAKALLSLFFGFPFGSSWRAISGKDFDFVIANPLYAWIINERTYVFAHGTHFRWEVTLPAWELKLLGCLAKLLVDITIKSGENFTDDDEMADLERKRSPFIDSLWPSSRNNPATLSDEYWYIVRRLRYLVAALNSGRKIPDVSTLYKAIDLPNAIREGRISNITCGGCKSSLERFRRFFCNPMLKHLNEHGFPTEKVTFVYGDTHAGGWADAFKVDAIPDLRVYNTGSWVVDKKGVHPTCHIFGVFDNGEEFMLDVSFRNVEVDGDQILDLAWQELEHRNSIFGRAEKLIGYITYFRALIAYLYNFFHKWIFKRS